MGIDFLDLFYRIERQFGVKVEPDDFLRIATSRKPPDVTAGELFELIAANGGSPLFCQNCRYDLRAHPQTGKCPECGSYFDLWQQVQELLAEVGGLDTNEVQKQSRLIHDLGFT